MRGADVSLWLRQIGAILRLELKKNFFGKRSLLVYLLALMPIGLLMLVELGKPARQAEPVSDHLFDLLQLANPAHGRVFGCAWIFMNLFRGEIVDRSLHYYFLSSVRREVLVTGKYVSGLLTSIILFTTVTIVCMLLVFLSRNFCSQMRASFWMARALASCCGMCAITILACVGYGAFFLVVGLFFRNPIIPALLLYGWEWINFLLPPLLKKISVIHYLNSLVPVPISEGPFAVVAEPTPAWISIPGLLIVTALVLILAGTRIHRMEVRYGSD